MQLTQRLHFPRVRIRLAAAALLLPLCGALSGFAGEANGWREQLEQRLLSLLSTPPHHHCQHLNNILCERILQAKSQRVQKSLFRQSPFFL
jgi:hypothetical protein